MKAFACTLLIPAFTFACGGELSADDYDRSCLAASDCAVIYEGNACDYCGASNTAIRADERAQWLSDLNALQSTCLLDASASTECDGRLEAVCINSVCEIAQ